MTAITVECLQNIIFSQLSLHDKIELRDKGRPTPDLIIVQEGMSNNKKYTRSFKREWYERLNWLCGCETRNALFCFPCLLFGGDTVWTKTGYNNLAHLKEKSESHRNSRVHLENVISLSLLGQENISEQLSDSHKQSILKHNEGVKKNREILSKIIDCIKFCGNNKLSFQECNESDIFENHGVFKGLLSFIATFDPTLQNHLDMNPVFKNNVKTIQNELLQSMLAVCQDYISAQINDASYLAVIADDNAGICETTQTAIVFRYELSGKVYERFWGFFSSTNTTANSLFICLHNEINKVLHNKTHKLIAQTYDGANVDRDIHHKIKQKFPNANFIHGYGHQLSFVLKHVTSSINSVRIFFANLAGFMSFFSNSPQRVAILNKHVTSKSWIVANNHWNTVNAVFENKDYLTICFEELQNSKTSDETIQASSDFLALLKNETFTFWLNLFHAIMPHVDLLNKHMVSRNIDTNKIKKALHQFLDAISTINNSDYCSSSSTTNVMESNEVCNIISAEVKNRYQFTYHLIAAKLFYKENFQIYSQNLPYCEILEICNNFRGIFKEKLETELRIFYSRKEFHNFDNLLVLLNMLSDKHLSDVFSEIIKLMKILITIPMPTAEPERCFSTLKRVQTFLKNTSNADQSTALSMILIEKNMIKEIVNFNEKVIEKFCLGKNGIYFNYK